MVRKKMMLTKRRQDAVRAVAVKGEPVQGEPVKGEPVKGEPETELDEIPFI